MAYTDALYKTLNDLNARLNLCSKIVNEYEVPRTAYDKTMKNIRFIRSEVDKAMSRQEAEANIVSTIDKTYKPYANRLYDQLRWFMNRVA